MKLSVVVPVFNEAATVAAVLERLLTVDLPGEREIIVVDDGSRDGTAAAVEAMAAGRAAVRVHRNPVNLGKGASLRIGFSLCGGDIVTVQDADLELDPAEYPALLAPILADEADVVYGSRYLAGRPPGSLGMYLGNRALTGLTNVLYGARLTDMETCYKVFRREVLDRLTLRANRFDIEPELTAEVLAHGFRLVERPVAYRPRSIAEGKKMRWWDGLDAVRILVERRLAHRRSRPS